MRHPLNKAILQIAFLTHCEAVRIDPFRCRIEIGGVTIHPGDIVFWRLGR
jgi:hypothetical protein